MPKTETVERFKVTEAEVGVADFGPAMVLLAQIPGLKVIGSELVTDVRAFARKTTHTIKSEDFLGEWIKDHPTFKAIEPVQAFKADGRTAGAAYTALRILTANKVLKQLGEGNYARTDVKSLTAPKKKSEQIGTQL